jgi:hypothetical protein
VKNIRQSEIANTEISCKENKYSTGIAQLEFLDGNACRVLRERKHLTSMVIKDFLVALG